MEKRVLLTIAFLVLSAPAMAQTQSDPITTVPQAVATLPVQNRVSQDPVMEQINYLQKEWARIKYHITGKDEQIEALHSLEAHALKVSAAYSDRPEPKIWEGIILATEAGIDGGISALGKVKRAKVLFEESINIDPNAMSSSAYTSLGSLYYQVPGWPIAFGDNDEAEKYLLQALQGNPDGLDSNFFYGDFLIEDHRYEEAKSYLEHALQAPPRPSRPLADAGRRQEIKVALAKINEKINHSKKQHYN